MLPFSQAHPAEKKSKPERVKTCLGLKRRKSVWEYIHKAAPPLLKLGGQADGTGCRVSQKHCFSQRHAADVQCQDPQLHWVTTASHHWCPRPALLIAIDCWGYPNAKPPSPHDSTQTLVNPPFSRSCMKNSNWPRTYQGFPRLSSEFFTGNPNVTKDVPSSLFSRVASYGSSGMHSLHVPGH